MFKHKVRLPDGRLCNFPESSFSCPNCGMYHSFFSICPKDCTICHMKFPDLRAMENVKRDRIDYHFGKGDSP